MSAELERDSRQLLVKLCRSGANVPRTLFIEGVTGRSQWAVASGGFADIYRATYQGRVVALKFLRYFVRSENSIAMQRVSRTVSQAFLHDDNASTAILPGGRPMARTEAPKSLTFHRDRQRNLPRLSLYGFTLDAVCCFSRFHGVMTYLTR